MSYEKIVHNDIERQRVIEDIRRAPLGERPFVVTIERLENRRSLSQNALSFVWYGIIAKGLGISVVHARCQCKLMHGVPILRAEDANFRDAYDAAIKPLSYELKLRAMEIFPVTSLMSVSQLQQYLDDIQRVYAEQGVVLGAAA